MSTLPKVSFDLPKCENVAQFCHYALAEGNTLKQVALYLKRGKKASFGMLKDLFFCWVLSPLFVCILDHYNRQTDGRADRHG